MYCPAEVRVRRGSAVLRCEAWYTCVVTLSIEIPEATLRALGPSPSEAEGKVRLAAAMKLHELGHLSAGAAADLAGIPKVEFLHKLADFGVEAFRMTPDQFDLDQDTLHRSLG
jgi:predicted HTH domain antitoxin